jgi:hypothetical protein
MALAKLWTWIGQIFVPLALLWAVYVRNGLPGEPVSEAVLISRGYWGLLVTLAAGASLAWTAALYVRDVRRQGARILVPPNTMFEEERTRSRIISWGTAIIFVLSVLGALILFGERYSDSRIYRWDDTSPLQSGFWSSRASAHQSGCGHGPCYAVSQRIYPGGPISGVNEYVLYVTDGGLVILTIAFLCGLVFLIVSFFRVPPVPPFEL